MTGGGITIEGAKETADALTSLGKTLEQKAPDLITDIMNLFVEKAQSNAPVDTGFLRDNIKITANEGNSGEVTSEAEYSIFVEEGTRYMSSQPFMQPALAETEREVTKIGTTWLIAILRSHGFSK